MSTPTEFKGLATVITHTKNPSYFIGRVSLDPFATEDGMPFCLVIKFCGTARYRALDTLDSSGPVWTGTRHNFPGDIGDVAVTVRNTVPEDAMVAYSTDICPKVPMPVAVLAYMHDVEFNVPHLYALSEDDGFVATMMLDTDSGIYIRYSNQWHEIVDEDAVDGLNVTEVADTALAMFDEYDNAGQLVSIDSMMTPDGAPAEAPVGESPSPVTAGALLAVPQLVSRDDLDGAITAAVDNPDLRWWVTRRVKALGFDDVTLPWET